MNQRPFGKHKAWKKAAAKETRGRERSRQEHARQDEQFWNEHLDTIVARRQARVTAVPSTSERLAAKRAAWRQPTE